MTHHHRRSIRLRDYDYTQNGAYFVTICTHEKRCMFGRVVTDEMVINEWGRIVQSCWDETPAHFPMVELDAFVVMPNHVHGVIVIVNDGTGMVSKTIVNDGRGMVSKTIMDDGRGMISKTIMDDGTGMACHAPTKREFSKPIAGSLSTIVGAFKSAVTKHINRLPNPPDHPIWQRNYYEHIIRHEKSLNQIRAYVANNAAQWTQDSLFTA